MSIDRLKNYLEVMKVVQGREGALHTYSGHLGTCELHLGDVAELLSSFSETVNQRDAALALLREAQEVLADHWFTSVMDGDYGEDFNNEDVIAMDDKIKKFLPEAPK